jgi:hypothetical protein
LSKTQIWHLCQQDSSQCQYLLFKGHDRFEISFMYNPRKSHSTDTATWCVFTLITNDQSGMVFSMEVQ